MAGPTTIAVVYISTLPSTTSTATISIPANIDYSATIQNLVKAGGASFVDSSGAPNFVPLGMIVKITAQ